MRSIFTYSALLLSLFACSPSQNNNSTQSDPTQIKVDSLLSLMTLEEKVGQLNLYNGTFEFTGILPEESNALQTVEMIKTGHIGAMLNVLTTSAVREAQKLAVENTRLGIPLLIGYDVIHGYQTMMPVPLAQAASWDPEVARSGAVVAAKESAASGVNWTFAPMMDIARDARWGRMMESAGEDPYLASVFSKAWVNGFQGDDLSSDETIAACAKHFAAYGFAEGGKDYNTVDISLHTLYNIVLPPFKAASEANVASFMNSFNEIGGVPANGSKLLQRQILKGDWDYKGFVVSDWGSIGEMITHGFAKDNMAAGLKAITAGSDMDMESRIYEKTLIQLVNEGTINESIIDDAAGRILSIKFKLGLFEDPYKYCDAEKEKTELLSKENLAVAKSAGQKSIVLLKNEDQILPLTQGKSIAIIGSLASSKDIPLGSWRAQAIENSAVSMLEGMISANPKTKFAEGYKLTTDARDFIHELEFLDSEDGFNEAIALAKKVDVVVMVLGEDCWQTGEGRSQVDITLKGSQERLFDKIVAVNSNIVAVLMTGRSLAIPNVAEKAKALVNVWHLGSEAGNAIADVLYGKYNPSGKLPVSFPRHGGQLPIYYNHKNTGRPTGSSPTDPLVFWSHYTDEKNTPLFPFGYGLSYSTFEYSGLKLSSDSMNIKGKITATINIKNTSDIAGKETVQLYLRDHFGSVTRPVKELKAYEQIELAAGEDREITFEIDNKMLSYYRLDLSFGSEPGNFTAMIGGNSSDVLALDFELLE
ncbi:MAG: beta-glucosidase BglX [Reichenbachiella sp.]